MFFVIPGEFIAIITFPGVVLHEIAHRFFCDIQEVPVYSVNYFSLFSDNVGHVIYKQQNKLRHDFLIAMAPLIINSIVFMLFTFSIQYPGLIGVEFSQEMPNDLLIFAVLIMQWVGFSAGYHAIPSRKDVEGLSQLAQSRIAKEIILSIEKFILFINQPHTSCIMRIFYIFFLRIIMQSFALILA